MTSVTETPEGRQPVPSQANPATVMIGRSIHMSATKTVCPDGIAFCLGEPLNHADPREHVHQGPEHTVSPFGNEQVMSFSLAQWDNDTPGIQFQGAGDWDQLDLAQTDTVIDAEAAHLAAFRATRDQLAQLLGADTKYGATSTAESAVRAAIQAENQGLQTHPRAVADALHRAIDDESARHLAKVGGHHLDAARADEAFGTANRAMEDALRYTPNRDQTIRALRAALEMTISESRTRAVVTETVTVADGNTVSSDAGRCSVVVPGAVDGAILNAELFTSDHADPAQRVTTVSVWSGDEPDADLDVPGMDRLIADLEGSLPRLRALRTRLAEIEAARS